MNIIALIAFLLAAAAAAWFGSRFRPDVWYRRLDKPSWNPPDAVFAPVWTTLYIAIAFAGWFVWRDGGHAWSSALTLWALQLVLNAAFSWLFFGLHRLGAALIDQLALLAVIVLFMVAAAPISVVATWLFVPYLAWCSFATLLNANLAWRNRDGGGPRQARLMR